MFNGCREQWLKAYEEEFNNDIAFSLLTVRPYIDFKLAYDFAFSDSHSIEITDKIGVENFLGSFCYNQIHKDFQRSAIVVQLPEERLYFGSTCLSKIRMRERSLNEQKTAASFDDFLTVLEERVFKCSLQMLDQDSKRNLAMVLRTINQGVSAVAMYMFDMFLKVRNGSYDRANFGSKLHSGFLIRPHPHDKGSTQIDISFGNDKIQVSRREHFQVLQLDPDGLVDPDESEAEKWSLLTLLSQSGSENAPWKLHFSALKDATRKRRANIPLESSTRSRLSKANNFDRCTEHAESFDSVANRCSWGLNFWTRSQPTQFQETVPNISKVFESALTDVSKLPKRSSDAVMYKQRRYVPSHRSLSKLDHISHEKDRRESAKSPRNARANRITLRRRFLNRQQVRSNKDWMIP